MNQRQLYYVNVAGNIVALALITLYFLLPYVWLITSAFRLNPDLRVEFNNFTLENFITLLSREDFPVWIRNSLVVGLSIMLLVIALGLPLAYLLARYEVRGQAAIFFLFIFIMTMPLSALLVPMYSLVRFLGLDNTLLGVILVLASKNLPISVWLMKEFIRGIPVEVEESAWIDGCGVMGGLVRVVLPLSAPAIAVVGMMAFLSGWGDLIVNLVLIKSEELRTIALGLYYASLEVTGWGYTTIDYGIMSAVGLVYIIPAFALYLVMQKYLIRGMLVGAVKA